MKRFSFYSVLLACFFGFSVSLFACNDPCGSDCGCCTEPCNVALEARIAYFHPSSKKVRRIYSDGWVDYQLEASTKLNCNWRLWAGVSGFSRKGESIGFHDKTKLSLVPVNLGLKYTIPVCCNTDFYVGGAVCYSFLHIKDHSDYVHKNIHKGRVGGLLQLGLYYALNDWAFMSIFADYYFQEFHFSNSNSSSSYYSYGSSSSSVGYVKRTNLNMSGYKVGFGWGAKF